MVVRMDSKVISQIPLKNTYVVVYSTYKEAAYGSFFQYG
jgi:hypothetical protein